MKSAAEVEQEQEQLLKARYAGLQAKKKPTMVKDHKFFDSADWALAKQQGRQADPRLQPKLEPSAPPPRRSSHLGEDEPMHG